MRKFLSLLFSACLVSSLIGGLWLIDIVRQSPEIPFQTPEGTFLEVVQKKKKHNHIDDFCIPCVEYGVAIERMMAPRANTTS